MSDATGAGAASWTAAGPGLAAAVVAVAKAGAAVVLAEKEGSWRMDDASRRKKVQNCWPSRG